MELNSNIDWNALKQEFAANKRVRIDNILAENAREEIYKAVSSEIAFSNAFLFEQQVRTATDQELFALSNENKQALQSALIDSASNGVGFLYGTYKVKAQNVTHPVLKQFFSWLNSKGLLSLIGDITDNNAIVSANCQGTRYKTGDYLTRHNDINLSEGREIAYVFNMTKNWHPDWGGLLQFYTQQGIPLESYEPRFNSLSLFDVSIPHSVTYVTPFAKKQRYAVTGWFCNKPCL